LNGSPGKRVDLVVVREVLCKSALTRCGIEGIEYSVNPYIGCEHSCVYCYARYMRYYSGHSETWGDFIDVKINIPLVLSRELGRKPRGRVILSTVTDPYQPLERRYKLTRRCLERLLHRNFPVNVMTKSSLVLRDLDLLSKFNSCEVGMTVITDDDGLRSFLEPKASSIDERLNALERIAGRGISTYAFVGPIIPSLNDGEKDLERLIRRLAEVGVDYLMFDRLNTRCGVIDQLSGLLRRSFPHLLKEFTRKIELGDRYYQKVKRRVSKIMAEYDLPYEFCF